jgi:hypothetical protein
MMTIDKANSRELTAEEQVAYFLKHLRDNPAGMHIFKYSRDTFAKLHRETANDPNLTWKAKGILLVLLDNVTTWNVNLQEIASRSKDGIHSLRTGLKELESAGYVYRQQKRSSKGRFKEYDTFVFETPELAALLLPQLSPDRTLPHAEVPDTENHTLTRVSNNKSKTNNESKHPPTPQGAEMVPHNDHYLWEGRRLSKQDAEQLFIERYPEKAPDEDHRVGKHLHRILKKISLQALIDKLSAHTAMHAKAKTLGVFIPRLPLFASNYLFNKKFVLPVLSDSELQAMAKTKSNQAGGRTTAVTKQYKQMQAIRRVSPRASVKPVAPPRIEEGNVYDGEAL